MKAKAMWKFGDKTGWSTTFRGIGIVIRVNPKTVTCTLEIAKKIAQEVVDQQIAEDAAWANAEYRHNSDIWKKP
jgi:hypothetical protein